MVDELIVVRVSLSGGMTFSEDVVVALGVLASGVVAAATGSQAYLTGGNVAARTWPIATWDEGTPSVGDVWANTQPQVTVTAADGSTRTIPVQCGRIQA